MAQLQADIGEKSAIASANRLDQLATEPLSGNWRSFQQALRRQGAYRLRSGCGSAALSHRDCRNVNDITAASHADRGHGDLRVRLGYYDYGWWAKLHAAGCHMSRGSSQYAVCDRRGSTDRTGSSILSDRTGHLPKRLAASRRNPMSDWSVRFGL